MSNPLFNLIGNAMPQNQMTQMIQQFQQFKQTFNGNPKQIVMNMLSVAQTIFSLIVISKILYNGISCCNSVILQ